MSACLLESWMLVRKSGRLVGPLRRAHDYRGPNRSCAKREEAGSGRVCPPPSRVSMYDVKEDMCLEVHNTLVPREAG